MLTWAYHPTAATGADSHMHPQLHPVGSSPGTIRLQFWAGITIIIIIVIVIIYYYCYYYYYYYIIWQECHGGGQDPMLARLH